MSNLTPTDITPTPAPAPAGGDGSAENVIPMSDTFYIPVYVLTAIFGAIFMIGPLVVPKGENRGRMLDLSHVVERGDDDEDEPHLRKTLLFIHLVFKYLDDPVLLSFLKLIIRVCIMLTAFCMWLFWVTVYIAQLNPLMGLRVCNTTLAWMAYTWGESAIKD